MFANPNCVKRKNSLLYENGLNNRSLSVPDARVHNKQTNKRANTQTNTGIKTNRKKNTGKASE